MRCKVGARVVAITDLGSMTIALAVNIGLIVVALCIAILLAVLDVSVLTLGVMLSSMAVVIPIATWPLSRTVCKAVDLRFHSGESQEVEEAAVWRAVHEKKTSVPPNNA